MDEQPGEVGACAVEARRRDSTRKHARALTVVDQMVVAGEPVTFAEVRRRAKVSDWLVYAEGVREHIDKARTQQVLKPARDRAAGLSGSTTSLRTDLELARAEARALRQERDQFKAALQRSLGHQLDQLGNADLVARVDELTEAAQRLAGERDEVRAETSALQQHVAVLEGDLTASVMSLRRMIREGNLPLQ
ncbi:DUF6262 family protein [Streptomyces bacillaris]|uniref:DUF6262 family protein n=1 Tax=Streptomyces bacillaris TaxID=68179 RepID=UPI0036C4A1C9